MITVLTILAFAVPQNWRTASPEEMGMDSTALVGMFDEIAASRIPVHSIQVVRRDRLVLDAYFYPYNSATRHDVASVTKNIMSILVGLRWSGATCQTSSRA